MRKLWAALAGGGLFLALTTGCTVFANKDNDNDGPGGAAQAGLLEAEISTIGIDYLSQSPVVLLRTIEGGRAVPIWIGIAEAQAIARALHGIEMPRPLTHDLTINLLAEGGMKIEEVIVHDMRDGIYYGKILVRKGEAEVLSEVDSRPSDALALAVRAKAVIRVSEAVLSETPDFHFVPPDVSEQVVQVLGMTVVTASGEMREQFGIGDRPGVLVSAASGVARERGIRAGDLIFRVNDRDVETPMDVLEEVLDTSPGNEAEIQLFRGGEEETLRLPVEGERRPAPEPSEPGVTI